MKKFLLFFVFLISFSLCACNSTDEDKPQSSSDLITGHWTAKGVLYNGEYQPFDKNSSLQAQYAKQWITIDENGSFTYQNNESTINGKWKKIDPDENNYSFMFEADTNYIGILTMEELSALVFWEDGSTEDTMIVYFKDN